MLILLGLKIGAEGKSTHIGLAPALASVGMVGIEVVE